MTRVQLIVEPIVFLGPAKENTAGLKLAVKRYTTQTSEDKGLTLLLTHCIASREFFD
jgi:hypothetical protein